MTDGRGLFLLVNPTGSRLWRWKYRVDGREPVPRDWQPADCRDYGARAAGRAA
ncbi:MAG: Arm DNA-binding domain-containing protein [Rhodanobacter sp.]